MSMTPDDVLKFWFGDEITAGPSAMDTSEYMSKSGGRWFSKNDDFDNEVCCCRSARSPRTVANDPLHELPSCSAVPRFILGMFLPGEEQVFGGDPQSIIRGTRTGVGRGKGTAGAHNSI
eukprot:78315-Rhodomonas_salina.2